MFDFLQLLALLAVPMLLEPLHSPRKGLVIGLFILLLFLTQQNILLLAVPVAVSVYLFFLQKKKFGMPDENPAYIKNPAFTMMLIFLLSMSIFCAFADAFYHYGRFLALDDKFLVLSRQLSGLGCIIGPMITGSRCDRKGPFSSAIFLSLVAELSILFAGSSYESPLLFLVGSFLLACTVSGFFVLMPLLVSAFYGRRFFLHMYPVIAACAALCWGFFRHFYLSAWSKTVNPADFLFNLLFLVIVSSFSVYMAWKRRLILIRPAWSSSSARIADKR